MFYVRYWFLYKKKVRFVIYGTDMSFNKLSDQMRVQDYHQWK